MKSVLDNLNSIPNGTMQFGKINVNTSAQAMTLIAYSESPHLQISNVPFSNFNFNAECKSFLDFCACLRIIGGYHGFDAETVIDKGTPFFNTKAWYPVGNNNHGRDLFRFIIAREYSATFYIEYSTYLQNRKLVEVEGERGDCEEFTADDFEDCMLCLKQLIEPSEFSVEKTVFEAQDKPHLAFRVRFCWT